MPGRRSPAAWRTGRSRLATLSVSRARATWERTSATTSGASGANVGGRAAEQPALAQRDAEAGERGQLGGGLDALGQQPGIDPAGELAEHLGQRHADRVGVGVADQGAVQLHDLGAQGGELLQPRVAAAGVVQGDERAPLAELVALAAQRGQVVRPGVCSVSSTTTRFRSGRVASASCTGAEPRSAG